ncbi:magnesium transporter [Desulfuromonas sp. KJ2020]|uniref:magnesium transporter n=1 Tax=Desulfuromonas sp. KJ2020 TaxID=2919173 RepID=UPI0020A7006A|nr:magnesium transporter [Desulfuromonas sp. KJ2020]MCP3178331.1 magnesium transporter [Desulfuromonas sp. KJ2020]
MKTEKTCKFSNPGEINAWLRDKTPLQIAEETAHLDPTQQEAIFRQINRELSLNIFKQLNVAQQERMLSIAEREHAVFLVEELDPDDRARLFNELSAEVVDGYLAELSPEERRLTNQLLSYPVESAGRIMSPEFLALHPAMTLVEALDYIRKNGRKAETVHTLPVTDEQNRLIGLCELSDLVLGAPERQVAEIMHKDPHAVKPGADQEEVARLLQAADMLAVPVVDEDGLLLGIVTIDDAMDVLTLEEGEDLARAGGAEPLGRPYFSVSDFRLAKSRVLWLVVLIFAATLTVQVLNLFESTLETVVSLALFIPLLIGTGGNAGAQSSTTIVRSMAVGDVQPSDFVRTILREARVGFLLGAMLGLLSYLPVSLYAGHALALVVSLTLVSICTLASVVGSVMPLAARFLGVDPAVASAPFVTTIVDATGLLVYFLIAKAVLNL